MTKLTLLASIALASAAPAQAPKPTELHFGDEPWHLALSLGDLKPIEGAASRPDRQVFTYSNDRGVVLSVIVENAHEPASMASCRDVFAQRKQHGTAGMLPLNEAQGQRGEAATQEYDLKLDYQGEKITQHNAFSCRVRGTYYVDVHASKILDQPGDHAALMAVIDGVAIVD
jgi:hypothetical protein